MVRPARRIRHQLRISPTDKSSSIGGFHTRNDNRGRLSLSHTPGMEALHRRSIRISRLRAGIILIGPSKIWIRYVVKLQYNATNNAAEYETLLTGPKLAIEVRAEHLKVYSDSQLVVN